MSIPGEETDSNDPYPSAHFARVVDAYRQAQHPTRIGPYDIVGLIGQGGMGNVYRAEQREPLQRTVAIKLIKPGMDSAEVIARFETERQALALMNHPNVAKVYDAGATESGRPYFVMEYVAGDPITRFADERALTIEQRLELLIQACEAVQHAHQKAIIHRDLKPSNILVAIEDGAPRVKVIDFGVAKAVTESLTGRALVTQVGQLVGTPEYMAPEQAEGGLIDVDTRSDVYSLGVVLYELLSGALPFDATRLRSGGYQSIQRIIRDVDPPRPSTRLSSMPDRAIEVARKRHVPLEMLERQLKGELEWIPLKAMRKDRADRYSTATELAEDIRNYLENRPLRAGPESSRYLARKFLRRNRRSVVAFAAMVLLLITGIVTTTWQAARAKRAERQTRAALQAATNANAGMQAVNDFLTQDLLWSAEPARTRGREMSLREAVDAAARDVGTRFRDRPLLEADVRIALAGTYDKLGRADLGLPHAARATQLIRDAHHELDPDGLNALEVNGELLFDVGRGAQAEPLLRSALDGRRHLLGPDHPSTIDSELFLGHVLQKAGNVVEAEALERDALDRSRRTLGDESPKVLSAMEYFSMLLKTAGRIAEAEAIAHRAADLSARIHGEDALATLAARNEHAQLLWRIGKVRDAEPILRTLMADRARIQGADHPDVLLSMDGLASLLTEDGRLDDADQLQADATSRARRVLGDEHPLTLSIINNLGRLRQRQGKLDESESLCRESLDGDRRVLGPDNIETLTVAINLAFVLHQEGKLDESETMLRTVIEAQRRALGNVHPVTLAGLTNLGGILFERKKFAQAEPLFREALAGRRTVFGNAHPETLGSISNLGRALEAMGRIDEAEPLFAELYRASLNAQLNARQAALFISHWGPALERLGRDAETVAPLEQAYQRLHETKQDRSEQMRNVLQSLVRVSDRLGRDVEASRWRAVLEALPATDRPASRPTSRSSASAAPADAVCNSL